MTPNRWNFWRQLSMLVPSVNHLQTFCLFRHLKSIIEPGQKSIASSLDSMQTRLTHCWSDYYELSRALWLLFRSITLDDSQPIPPVLPVHPLSDPIGLTRYFGDSAILDNHSSELFQRYADELRYICVIHTLSYAPIFGLLEAEVVIVTILVKCP